MGVPWGVGGGGQIFFLLKFNQIWCVSYLHEWHMHCAIFGVTAPWGLGEGPKGQISLNLNCKLKTISKIFKPNFVYFLANERYITSDGIFIWPPGSYSMGGTWGYRGGSKFFFSEIQPDLVCELLT